jgi:8-oxo-dGTP diphosphatase
VTRSGRSKPLRVVCAVILHRGRMLAARRLPGGFHLPMFEFPGGKIIAGETPFDAIRREILEELGLEIRPLAQGPSVRHDYPERCVELIPVLCDRPRGTLRLTAHSEIRWIRPDRWESLEWLEADRELILKQLTSAKGIRALYKKKSQSPAGSPAKQTRQSPGNPKRQK